MGRAEGVVVELAFSPVRVVGLGRAGGRAGKQLEQKKPHSQGYLVRYAGHECRGKFWRRRSISPAELLATFMSALAQVRHTDSSRFGRTSGRNRPSLGRFGQLSLPASTKLLAQLRPEAAGPRLLWPTSGRLRPNHVRRCLAPCTLTLDLVRAKASKHGPRFDVGPLPSSGCRSSEQVSEGASLRARLRSPQRPPGRASAHDRENRVCSHAVKSFTHLTVFNPKSRPKLAEAKSSNLVDCMPQFAESTPVLAKLGQIWPQAGEFLPNPAKARSPR